MFIVRSFKGPEGKREEETKRWFHELVRKEETKTKDYLISAEVVEVGGSFPEHAHDVEQAFFTVTGQMTFIIDGEEVVAGPQTLIFVPAWVRHAGYNSGEEEAIYVYFDRLLDPSGEIHVS